MDLSVLPGSDFFSFANGSWLKQTEIPPDRSGWSVAAELQQETALGLRALLEATVAAAPPPASEARKVADYYSSFMDEAAIEGRGITPLKPALDRIAALKTKLDLARELGESLRADVDPLNNTDMQTDRFLGLFVSPGFDSPERNVPYLLQGGLGMPDRDYYLDDDARMQELRQKYQAHVAAVLRLGGIADADAKAARVLGLETKIARAHSSREDSSQVLSANNPWRRGDFSKQAPGLDWGAFFHAAGLDAAPMVMVWQPSALTGEAALVGSEPLADWQSWLSFHTIDRRARVLPKAFVEEDFAFYGRALRGTPQLEDRWKRAVRAVNGALPDAVGKLYVEKHFAPESKAKLQAMVQTIVDAFRARVEALDWMAPETKAKALAKLSTLYVGVGYPDHWLDSTALEVVAGDALGNLERAELAEYRRNIGKLGKSSDKSEWWMPAQVVNALNLPLQNALNFPAAILAPPFFDPEAPPAVNYGAIGAVIGHEISHSFDDQGAQFDEAGRLSDWWTKADREHFEASGKRLVEQYDAYRPFADLHVNGKLTLGENIADLAGLAASHEAWVASLGGQPAPEVQGFTGEQQFFIAYAQTWRGKDREPSLRQQIITDGHAPEAYRAATVRNLDAWY
ncbi:MAG TPA: M13 family metallopeptidase, partial [Polyangiaceae bacterium]|nr:M13 family metallopeptidase [Polyangiaceae bacterium]